MQNLPPFFLHFDKKWTEHGSKGEVDFFSCWLQLNDTTGFYHDLHDCTSESAGTCQGMDSTMTLSMASRSFDVVAEMARFVGEPVDPKWAEVQARLAPYTGGCEYTQAIQQVLVIDKAALTDCL